MMPLCLDRVLCLCGRPAAAEILPVRACGIRAFPGVAGGQLNHGLPLFSWDVETD
jgi:hypothetical protein